MMKRVSIFVLLLAACLSLAAQDRTVKGVVIYATDGEPVVGAEVRVKGLEIQTLTDVDGRFTLDVPADARKLRITSIGMQTRTISLPEPGEEGYGEEMMINVLREERVVTPFVQIGISAGRPKGDDGPDASDVQVGYKVGVGVSFALSHYWSITPSVNFTQRTARWEMDTNEGYINSKLEPLYIDIPILAELKLWGKNNFRTIISAGPYLSFGVGGKYTTDTDVQDPVSSQWVEGMQHLEGDVFGDGGVLKKFDVGVQFGLGWLVKHVYFGFNVQYGLTNCDSYKDRQPGLYRVLPSKHVHNFLADFTLAYRF